VQPDALRGPDDCLSQPVGKDGSPSLNNEIGREGAWGMAGRGATRDAYIAAFASERDESGWRLVVGNG